MILGIVAVIGLFVGILASGYVKAPPDKAYIISGVKKNKRVLKMIHKRPVLFKSEKIYSQMSEELFFPILSSYKMYLFFNLSKLYQIKTRL